MSLSIGKFTLHFLSHLNETNPLIQMGQSVLSFILSFIVKGLTLTFKSLDKQLKKGFGRLFLMMGSFRL